ncbi:Zn-ribbon domain-containing OB-fold protein [Mycobacterium sp. 94-17]|uniref:Zn-ribbon domain-containing OB-fold protein n=1 Tax=Mycobacterium sp. 94-17 TaxID=2986147 RepID=UPI002D1EBF08|nr:OB-fold domain-containing protein [Mycobacterium sp. 94-17]MEB4209709.1 OB-fold domain-containing protein [Mycobacterium sp. 94-17]
MTANDVLSPQTGPVPHSSTPTSRPFWDGCREAKLRYQRCAECGEANFPPVDNCRNCMSDKLGWRTSRGRGEVYSWTVVYRPVTAEFAAPYAPAIVTLREGYQMLTNIVGLKPEALRVGLRVRVEFFPLQDDLVLPYFTAAHREPTRRTSTKETR